MAYLVRVSPSALADIEQCYIWMLHEYSEVQATKWYNGIVDAIYSLEEYPSRCAIAPEAIDVGIEIRQLLYGKRTSCYRILFAICSEGEENIVRVYRVWHGARGRIELADIDL